ncbi:MAG: aminoacyl-tRNA hydrolase [Candidatus Melainabacteria bacterium]|nr:aminoacyl-tRNA hydrolase [Candidatus Melainabacteria bacterium]
MKIVVGLGNPGSRYEMTRHNVGFRLVEKLAQQMGADFRNSGAMQCDWARVKFGNFDVVLVKPLTYMNLSGQSVQKVLHWYKVDIKSNSGDPSSDLIVVHDDVSLNLGRLRFQKAGGAGGQHGVESIIECLSGNKQFDRLKIGVGPDPGGASRGDYVLSTFPPEQQKVIEEILLQGCEGIKHWLKSDIDKSANRFNALDLSVLEPKIDEAK